MYQGFIFLALTIIFYIMYGLISPATIPSFIVGLSLGYIIILILPL